MKIVVLKFGGTSVGTIERIKKVSEIVKNYVKKRYSVIVVCSAMSGSTNELIKKSKKISNNFSDAEYDVLVSSGEQVSCSLIAGRLVHLGLKSRSWTAWQIPIFTENKHKFSRINHINKSKLLNYLKSGGVPIVTGFQGVNRNERITTIGRGGSDSTAIMLAKFLKADKLMSSKEQSAEITSLILLVILSFMKSDLYLVKKNITATKRNNNIDISKNIFFTTPIYNLLRILTSFSVKNRYLPLTVFFFVKPAKEVLSNLVTM